MDAERRRGLALALAAFGFWGFAPLYFKAIRHVAPLDILAHRVVWSVPFLAALLSSVGTWTGVRAAIVSRRTLGTLAVTAVLVSVNWLTFIYGVTSGRILDTSLGYYINPLVNVLLGLVFLRERLTRPQAIAVLLAAAGTFWLTVSLGRFPWIALTLALSFGVYGLLRRGVAVDSMGALFVETTLLFPVACGFLVWLGLAGRGAFVAAGPSTSILLACAGFVTAIPLIWFAGAARRLPFSWVGLCQYLAPSLTFLLGVFVYDEPFTAAHGVAFACIWTALALFSADLVRSARLSRDSRDPAPSGAAGGPGR
ncbi:MAG TPA: EamA family transporter RarD [Candidatus Polarisedimenticolaceae bacterium]